MPGIRVGTLDFQIAAPIWAGKGRTSLVGTAAYRRYSLGYRNWSPPRDGVRVKAPQALELGLDLVRRLKSGWTMSWALVPGLWSDFEDEVTRTAAQLRGHLVFGRAYGDDLLVGFGVQYSRDFGRALALPVLHLQWVGRQILRIDASLPQQLGVYYLPGSRVAFGLRYAASGGASAGAQTFYGIADPEVRYAVSTLGPSLRVSLPGGAVIVADYGVTLSRQMDLYSDGRKHQATDLRRSAFGRVGLELWP